MDAVGDDAPEDGALLSGDDDGLIDVVMRQEADDALGLLTEVEMQGNRNLRKP